MLEACLREYVLNRSPVYLVAVRETTRRLNQFGLNPVLTFDLAGDPRALELVEGAPREELEHFVPRQQR